MRMVEWDFWNSGVSSWNGIVGIKGVSTVLMDGTSYELDC